MTNAWCLLGSWPFAFVQSRDLPFDFLDTFDGEELWLDGTEMCSNGCLGRASTLSASTARFWEEPDALEEI